MPKATFPHLGNFYIPGKAFFDELGFETIIPPPISQRTINLGTKIAPEFACFPLKINLGNYLEAINAGAEIVCMAGGVGPCRFGYYGELQREILEEEGYDIEFFTWEAPKTHFGDLWKKIKRYVPKKSPLDLLRALQIFWLKAYALDKFDRMVNKIRPLELQPGATSLLQKNFYQALNEATLVKGIQTISRDYLRELKTLPVTHDKSPLKIVLLGEIYMVLEPRVNFQLEKILGGKGIEVHRSIYLTDWILEHLGLSIFKPGWLETLKQVAGPYLKNPVGGHGLESIAHTVEAGINRFDGVIHLAPFTCMPEIIALQVIPDIIKDLAIPVLSIIIDEHSAEAGVETRLEAFIDLLKYRKRQKKYLDPSPRESVLIAGREDEA